MSELNVKKKPEPRSAMGKVKTYWRFIRYIWESFAADSCQTTAAALTYQTLFAVVPLLTVTYAAFNAFPSMRGLSERVESFIFNNIIPENVSVVKEYLLSFSEQARNLGGPSVGLLALTAFLMLFTIERTFNEIWRVKEFRHGMQRFFMYWVVLTLALPFMGISLVITGYIETLPFIIDVQDSTATLHLVPIILNTSVFTMVYAVVPYCTVPWRHAAIGGLSIAVIFEIATMIFASTMALFDFEAIYGTFAAVPLFLLWIYVCWTIVLLGAEFVKSIGVYRFDGAHEVEEPLFQMIVLLEQLYLAHQNGEMVTEKDIRRQSHRIDLEQWAEMRSRLLELRLIRAVDNGGLVLSKDLSEVSVWDLYSRYPWQLPRQLKGEKAWEKKLFGQFTVLNEGNRTALDIDLESLFKEAK